MADRSVSVSITLSDSNPGFKVTVYLQVEYLNILETNLLSNINRKSYPIYRMVIPLSMTLRISDPDFKVTSFFEVEYLKNGAS